MAAASQGPSRGRPERTDRDLAYAAFVLLRAGFGIAPILFGIDKFFDWMVEWPYYLWSGIADVIPGSAQQIMYGVGVIEILAGILVLLAPRIGGPLVAAWLGAIVVNLVILSALDAPVEPLGRTEYWDIALRDLGLMVGATALSLLAFEYKGSSRSRRG